MNHIHEGTYFKDGVEYHFRLVADHQLTNAEIKDGILAGAKDEIKIGTFSHTAVA